MEFLSGGQVASRRYLAPRDLLALKRRAEVYSSVTTLLLFHLKMVNRCDS